YVSPKLFNTIDAAYFFNGHTLASGLTENRLFSAVPGFLTAMGVLGTFLGLTFGLNGIDFKDNDISKITEGINAMVNGAGTAFVTSLWGVGLSLTFNRKEKALEREIKERIARLQVRIDRIFPRIVAEQTLAEIKSINRDTEMHLAELGEKIGDQMQIVMDKTATSISNSITDGLRESLAPAVEKLLDNSREGSEKMMESLMQEFIRKIGNAGETQRIAMDNASQALAESSSQMMIRLTTFVEQLDAKVTEVRDGNRQMLEQMQDHFASQVSNMQSQVKQQNDQATEFTQKLAESMQDFNQKNQEMLYSMQTLLSERAIEQAEQFAKREENLTASADSFMEKLAKAIEDLNRNNEEMLKAMESGLKERLNALADMDKERAAEFMQQAEKGRQAQQSLTDSVKDVLETQNKQNDKFSEKLTALYDSFERVAQANKAGSEAMVNASNKINNSAIDFDHVATRLQTALANFDAKLATIILNIEKVTRENSNTATLFNVATSRLETSGTSLEKTVNHLDATAQTTKVAFESMKENFTHFASLLKEHIEELNAEMSELLIDYSKRVQDQTNERLDVWNSQTKEYTSSMTAAVQALSNTVDEIETKLPKK
ncbi:hypothetical protein BKK52_12670, partial [Rodentibacter trehalosifermentans]